MSDYLIVKNDIYKNRFINNSANIRTWLLSNPGSTLAEIDQGSGVNDEAITSQVLKVMMEISLAFSGQAGEGDPPVQIIRYWHISSRADLIESNINQARIEVENQNSLRISELAIALGVHFSIAQALTLALQAEGTSKMVA